MSMHLVGPYMTTTVYSRKKSKVKKKTAKQIQSELKHEKYLRKMGAHPDQRSIVKSVKCYGSTSDSKPEGRGSTPRTDANPPTYDPSMSKRTPNVYTGTEITGIATMHKSNAVPVRGKKQAIEIANMRRG
jgi:hypothetical protein